MEQNQTNFSQPAAGGGAAAQPVNQSAVKMPGAIALLKESLNVYKTYFSSLISISLLFLLGTFLALIIPGFGYSLIFLAILTFSLNLLFSFFIPLALIIALRSLMAGEPTQTADSLKLALGLLLPAIGIHILSTLVIAGAIIPLLIPGIIVGILLTFSIFSLVMERQYGLNALMRSRHLVKGNVSAVFLRMFIFGLIIGIPIVFFSLISGALQLSETIRQIFYGFLNVLIFPLTIVYSYLLFRFLSRQRPLESFNPQEKRDFYKGLMVWGGVAIVALIIAAFLLLGAFPSFPLSFFKNSKEEGSKSDVSELLKRSRDLARISDLSTLKAAISFYLTDIAEPEKEWVKICLSGKVYASNKGTTAVDGTGWLPIDFTKISAGSPIGALPKDPLNEMPYYFYRFACDAKNLTFELNADMESDYYLGVGNGSNYNYEKEDNGDNDKIYEVGTDLRLIHW